LIFLRVMALVLCIFIPGWLGISLIKAREEILGNGERLFLVFALGTGIMSFWALILALTSIYSLTALLLAVSITAALMALAARRRALWLKRMRARDFALALAIVAVALVLFAPPWSIVFGWSDVGVYANIATHVEEEGEISVENRTASQVDEGRRDLLYYKESKRASPDVYFENQFFIIDDFESGTTRPWFYFLWPSLMAVFASFLGANGMHWAITAAAVLALWGFFVLASRLLGGRWAIAAAALFALSPLILYFSHYTTSEMMNLMLFLSGSICLLAYLQAGASGGGRGLAILSASFYTLGFLCRIDFVFLMVPIILCYLARRYSGTISGDDYWFLASLSAGAAFAVLAGLFFSKVYFRSIWTSFFGPLDLRFALIVTLFATAVIFAFIFADKLRGYARRLASARVLWISALWLFLCAAFVFLYFIRPLGEESMVGYGFIKEARGPSYVEQNLVRWGWYMSFAGLAAVFAGYGAWFTRRRGFGEYTLGLTGFAFTLLYAWNMRAMPMHILAMRRLVPVIFAMAIMAIVYAMKSIMRCAWALKSAKRVKWVKSLAGAFVLGFTLYLLLFSANASIPVIGLDESGNQAEICEEIAGDVGEDGTLIMDYHLGDLFGSPLRCIYGIENAWLKENEILARRGFLSLLDDLGFSEEPIYLLWRPQASGDDIKLAEPLDVELVSEYRFIEESLEKSFVNRPDGRDHIDETIVLYRLWEECPGSGEVE
jgi:hypothetical protein